MTKTRRSALVILKSSLSCPLWLLLTACGGGSGGSGTAVPPPPGPPPPPPTQVTAEGIWTALVVVRCDLSKAGGLITHEGGLFVGTPAGIFIGSITEGPPFGVSAVNYKSEQDTPLALVAQPNAETLEITSVEARSSLRAQWAAQGSICTSIGSTLQYDAIFERPASLAIIAGVYTNGSLSMAVNSDGVVSGSDMNNCVLNGTLAVIHADRNYYSATIDVDNCAANGSYEGAAFIEDAAEGGQDNQLRLAVANSQHAIWLRLIK